MPAKTRVAVNSNPRLHGIFDTINSTLATANSETYLPQEFYDTKLRKIVDRILVDEEYSGYRESLEYRTVGIGALLGEVVERMIHNVQHSENGNLVRFEKGAGQFGDSHTERGGPKFFLSGSHDSTLAAILASLGAFEGENGIWPSYTSSLAVELFKKVSSNKTTIPSNPTVKPSEAITEIQHKGGMLETFHLQADLD